MTTSSSSNPVYAPSASKKLPMLPLRASSLPPSLTSLTGSAHGPPDTHHHQTRTMPVVDEFHLFSHPRLPLHIPNLDQLPNNFELPSGGVASSHSHSSLSSDDSRESLESDAIATPSRRDSASTADKQAFPSHTLKVDTNMVILAPHPVRPNEIICTTDGEDELPARKVWTPSPPQKPTKRHFWQVGSGGGGARNSVHSMHQPRAPSRPSSPSLESYSSRSPSSSPQPRSSSEHSSWPAIRVSESARGAPRLSFIKDEDFLGPPMKTTLLVSSRSNSPSGDSVTTITPSPGKCDPTSTPRISTSYTRAKSPTTSTDSPVEPSPISRKRRLNALKGLVANLDFAQPWSVIDQHHDHHEDEHDFFWPCGDDQPPQLQALSLGGTFAANDISKLANESTVSLPASPVPDHIDESWPIRTRKFSRSMVSMVGNNQVTDDDNPSHWPERPISPPMHAPELHLPQRSASPPLSLKKARAVLGSGTPPRVLMARTSSGLRRPSTVSSRIASSHSMREPPRPPRQRKESFGLFGVAHAGYSKSSRAGPSHCKDSAASWRESLIHDATYTRLMSGPDGHLAVKRQEVLWEMAETEFAFVRACRDVLRLFANPLRSAQGEGEWMSGIPSGVCELFETLEVVTSAHNELSTSQQLERRKSDLVSVEGFIAQFHAWVPSLACHEPYIVLFNPVSQLIEESARDDSSTFGEFIRMQMRDKALGSLSLGSMLLKPIQRLTKYPLFLRRLLDATPSSHPAHQSLVNLIESTETVLSRLESTKAGEDDFQQLLALEERVDGLPAGFELAVRGRRLVAHAQVVQVGGRESRASLSSRGGGSMRSLRATLSTNFSTTLAPSSSKTSPLNGRSTPGAISPENRGYAPQALVPRSAATSPSSAASSIRSVSRPVSRSVSRSTSPVRQERTLSRSASCSSSLAENARPRPRSSMSTLRTKVRRDATLTLVVFNDMVALAVPVPGRQHFFKSRKPEPPRLRILPMCDGGLGTVDDVRDIPACAAHSRAFSLTLHVPDGHTSEATFTMAPMTALSRRTQRTAPLAGAGLDTIEQVVGAVRGALGMGRHPESTDDEDDDSHEGNQHTPRRGSAGRSETSAEAVQVA